MHVCILGAGVIGVSSAYRLLADGHQVTLIDAEPTAGSQTSYGNGAQLSYSYVAPLADPSIWTQWPHYLLSSSSPLSLRLGAGSGQLRWLAQFLAASNSRRVKRTTQELLQLACLSREELATWEEGLSLDFAHKTPGKLVMYSDAAGLAAAAGQIKFQAQYGCEQEIVNMRRCLEIEPALAAASKRWAGGVHTPSEAVGDCPLFCRQLVLAMEQQAGFRFVPATRITAAVMSRGELHSVLAGEQQFTADAFVLAMGANSAAFAAHAGFALPVYPLKGYSITVPLTDDVARAAAPQVSITDLSRKIVYARLGDQLRVAGRVELVGHDRTISPRAIAQLKQGVRELFPASSALDDEAALSPWMGFRPATPTGVPLIGRSPVPKLFLNVGHGALGWTLACGSAALLAAHIGGRATPIDATPFLYNGL
ncbi:D-amino acid dehydrogenase [Herbaspirillum sp. RTI4]|uniref:D-amino acid dehydrogenase n=1 Tax=Herbaspirillum sp. RTI4 TaxID=3048640 RepID=UPI002AB35D98|nr:D-amino acid dehydrogenase [Herbaspirillum sp. RTI4]MDY7577467.1 D-amino acid dehydrogenase [Herbaspirillum sp. RTI4]MEA9981743.1 D-amino acid dehydrogenase [Herbaspirillum sp. RTI4]